MNESEMRRACRNCGRLQK